MKNTENEKEEREDLTVSAEDVAEAPREDIEEHTEPISADEDLPTGEELTALIQDKKYAAFVSTVSEIPSVDIAEIFDEIDDEIKGRFFRLLPKETAAEVFIHIDSEQQEKIITSFSDKELAAMLEELYIDDTVDIIEEMPANVVKRILRNSSSEDREQINRLLRYPRDSAGTIMTTEYVRFKGTMTVREALDHIRRVAIDKETIYTCYVTDDKRRLEGIVTAKQLLISDVKTRLCDIMEDSLICVTTTDDKEDVANKFNKYGFLALPVVDNERRLVGIITVDDAIDVIKEEVEEDISKMAAITPTETPYFKTNVFRVFKSRIPWLLLLMVSATLSSTILARFENNLASFLVLFVPMIMDTGGNSGNQASVTLVRGLSTGQVELRDFLKVWWRELRVGMLCGITLGTVAFGKILLVDHLLMGNADITALVAFVVALTMAITIIIAKFIGSSLPILASKIGLDPAVVASPFITTTVDALALIIYYLIASPFFPAVL